MALLWCRLRGLVGLELEHAIWGHQRGRGVAAAVRYIVKTVLGGGRILGIPRIPQGNIEILRGNIASEKGIGQDIITRFLKDVPRINRNSVDQALANLKASGD